MQSTQCQRRHAYYIVPVLLLALLFVSSAMVHAHGAGAEITDSVNGYIVDIGLSSEGFTAGDLSRFDFVLIDEETGEEVPFSDVWVRINQGREVFLATGIHRPELGQTGISYAFPSAGEYQVNIRYQRDGETLAEYTFPVTVTGSSEGGSPLGDKRVLGILLGTVVIGLGAGFFIGKKSAV